MLEIVSANTIIYCNHLEKTEAFYAEILGLQERFRKDDWFVEYILKNGSCLSLADASRCTIDASNGQGLTLSFQVKNLVSLFVYLKENNLDPTGIRENTWRAPYFFVRDPENNRVEFWAEQTSP